MKKWWPLTLGCGTAVLVGGLVFLAWQHYFPVVAGEGWSYRVYAPDIPLVSALARDQEGILYVTQELKAGRGAVFTLDDHGNRQLVLGGLSKPDGLAPFGRGIAVSQEEGDQPVLQLTSGRSAVLFSGRNVEGLASDGRYLYAVEDLPGTGRLLRYDPASKETLVLREGLFESEGVAVCPDGRLFYVEKGRRWVKLWHASGADELVVGGLNAPGFVACNEDGLWIAEDATHRARLLLLDPSGVLHTVLSHLRSAQTLLPLEHGRYLLAEQGRGRVLEVNRETRPAR